MKNRSFIQLALSLLTIFAAAFAVPAKSFAQTTLAQGDAAIVAINSANPDTFAFVFLKEVAAGTAVNFTDNGFTAGTTGRTGEGFLTYTVPAGGHTAGTVLTWTNGMTISGTGWSSNNPSNFAFNGSGDQLYIFQGTTGNWASQSGITLIDGVNYGTALSATSSASNTVQPTALTTAFLNLPATTNANGYFANGTTSTSSVTISGSPSTVLSLLVNSAKWFGNSGAAATVPSFSISVASATITGAAMAAAFTTTYGVPSAAQGFSVSGSNLTADITATAPTGFEVSSDNNTFGGTATIAQSGGAASGTIYIRLAATAAVSGSYDGKNIVLSSTAATSVNIATAASGNSVAAAALTIAGVSGTAKTYDGTTTATLSGTASYSGLVNGESFVVSGAPVATFASANVGTGIALTVSGYAAPSANYALTQPSGLSANIDAADLTITATAVTKPQGAVLTGGAGYLGFISSGLVNSETIGSVTVAYGSGAAAGAVAATYPGSVMISNATGGTFAPANYSIAYVAGDLTVSASPSINASGVLSAVNATYGSASSSPASFEVSGGNLTDAVTVAAPAGFEVSTAIGAGYSPSVVLTPVGGTVAATTIYVRLSGAATVAGSPYAGNIACTSEGATRVDVATAPSTVAPKGLAITGVNGQSKEYDRTNVAVLAGAAGLSGVVGSDEVSLGGTPTATFADGLVGNTKPISVTGYSLAGAAAGNYSVSQPMGLSADITPKPLTIAGAAVTAKPYDGNTNATITGTLAGVIAPDVVTFTGAGTFANAGPGTGIEVTASATLGGADAANYSLTQPTGLIGDITASTNATLSDLTIDAGALSPTFTQSVTQSVTDFLRVVPNTKATVTVTPTTTSAGATVTVNGQAAVSGAASASIGLSEGINVIPVVVTAQDNTTTRTYTIRVIRQNATTLAAGDIAFTGFNADGNDNLAFAALAAIPMNTVIFFSDEEWTGTDWFTNTEGSFVWVANSAISAGTIVTLNDVSNLYGGSPAISSNLGTVLGIRDGSNNSGIGASNEAIYAFQSSGALNAAGNVVPATFLALIANDAPATSSAGGNPYTLTNTGLSEAAGTAIIFTANDDAVRYKGPRNTQTAFADYLTLIANRASNWESVGGNGDGTTYVPFSTTAFTLASVVPTVSITATDASAAEAGTDPGTFRITRSGDTTNALTVSYAIATGAGQAVSADYAETLSGTVIIPGTQSFVDVTITPVDDVLLEGDETVTLTIQDAVDYDLGGNVTASVTITDNETSIDLSRYVRVARYGLPHPTNTAPPDAFSLLCQEASSVTWNWDTDTLFITGDGGTSIVQVSKTGQYINSMTLAAGSSPQGTEFYDTEGLSYVGGGKFVLVEERYRQVNLFTYVPNATLQRANVQTVKLGTTIGNVGIEGICYDAQTGGFIGVKEKDPESIFQTAVDFNAGTATNGSPSTVNLTDLFTPALANTSDFSDIFVLANLPTLNGKPASGDLLLISQESGLVRHLDRSGNILSTLTITADVGDTVTIPDMTMEGVTMDRNGVLYIVNENGGGDSSHPQLWVYAPSTAVNLAPTAITLNNAVTSLPEDSNTSSAVKLADILVTDDGLGTNDLSITGADASFFQIVGTALQLKPGVSLSAATKPSYSITVNVDDTSVGSTPDASTSYTLTITAASGGVANLIISEVAPWSSTNGAGLNADWFEVTNIGTAAADITGWKVDDSAPTFATAIALNGITSIAPGESVIFIETSGVQTASGNAASFRALWFGAGPPANLQIGSYSGSGIGLSTGGDAVNLFDAGGTIRASVTFGSSPSGPSFPTFDNAVGLNGTAIATLSVVGTHGAFTAVGDANEIGSPGTIAGSSTPIITIVATDASAAEQGSDPGTFRISRTGTTVGNLTVNYTVATGAGQAVAADYAETLSGSAIIPSGSTFVDLTITPVDDVAVEGSETVTLMLFDTGSYDVGSPDTATVTIADNDIANQPPTAVVLSNTVPTLREDASTSSAVRVADIAITDDGQGTNTLSLSGTDAAFFEIAGASLYLKAGTALSYSTKPGYSVTVNVDDASVGANPDASTSYTLAITQFVAPGTIIVSEVAPWSSGNSGALNADWFEVTNIGSSVVNIAGWKIDDNSNAFANAVALTGITTIAAGESVIFIESSNLTTSAAAFRALWFGANPPAGLQIGAYSGSGVGLGTSGDAVNLFDAAGNRVTGINVGASPAGPFATFDNAAGAGGTTLPLPTVSTLSTAGVHGAFVAANDANETGSPGTIVTVPTGSVYQIELSSYTVAENAGLLPVKIIRTGATLAADVTFTTTDGTARAGTDFTAPANPVHLDSGATFVNVSVPITDLNSTPQGNRSFTAAITAVPVGSTIGGSPATITITEAEGDGGVISFAAAPTLSVSPKTSNGSGAPNTVAVVIHRGTSAGGAVSFDLAASVPATVPTGYVKLTNGTDYTYAGETVTFTNGQTTKTVNIPLAAAARKGQFKLTATNVTGGTFPAATLTIQVEAKDSVAPTLAAALSGSSPTITGNTTAASLTLTATAADPASTASSPSSGLHRVEVNVKSVSIPLTGTTTTYLAPAGTATLAGGVPVTLEAGLNTFTVTAYDNAGNSKVVTVKRTFVNTDLTGLAGTYLGLLLPQNLPANVGTSAVSNDNVGFVSVTVSATAAVSGKLMMSGLTLPFTGVLANGGTFRAKTTNTDYIDLFDRAEFESYLGALSFGVSGHAATGALKTSAAGSALATFTAEKQFASPQTIPASVIPSGASAKYTLAIPAPTTGVNAGVATFPQGDGWATITVTGAGVVSVRGKLADGTNLSLSNKLHGTGANSVPLYAPLYRRNGAFAMELTFANATDSDVSGTDAVWIRPNQPRARYFKAGWANGALVQPVGTLFTPPTTTSILLGITTGTAPAANIEVQLGDGDLDSTAVGGSETRLGRIGNIAGATLNKFTKPPTETDATFTLALSAGAGTFTGKFKHTDGTVLSYQGVVLQKGANRKGFGYFLSTPPFTYGGGGQSGGVTVLPLP